MQFPIGIYKIKSYCKEEYKIFIVDERIQDADKEIEQLINQNDVLCLGLSVMTGQQICSAIRLAKKYHARLPVVWGGVHPTICPESVLDEEYVDYIIRGDGEAAFLELLKELETGREELDIDYEVHRLACLNESVIDFDEEIIPQEYFIKRDGFSKAFPLETSRGCPHKCAFCHNSIFGQSYRTVDTVLVIKNIEQLYNKYAIDGVIFQEDNFFLKKDRVVDILDALQSYKIGWKANSRLSYFDKLLNDSKIMKLIVDSNCHVLQFGIESGSNRILKMINKGISVEEIVRINKRLSEYDIAIRYNFIIGFPTESRDEIEATLKLIDQLLADNPHMEPPFVNIYTPYPGTPLYDLAKKEGFVPPHNLEEWSQIVWNYPNETLHRDKQFRDLLSKVSNDFLKESKYLR